MDLYMQHMLGYGYQLQYVNKKIDAVWPVLLPLIF